MTTTSTAAGAVKTKVHRHRRTILVMLTAAMVINYMDRSALAVAMPFITTDMHLTAVEKGLIFSSFSFGYALFNFVGGVLCDRFGATKVLTYSMAWWSVICGLTAGAFNFWTLLVARALFGAGEGPVSTTANKVVNNWFPVQERARSVGINQAGGPLGGAISGPVVGMLALHFGWRAAFVVIALIGLTWALIWRLVATDTPRENRRVDAAELAEIEAGTQASDERRDDVGSEAVDVAGDPQARHPGHRGIAVLLQLRALLLPDLVPELPRRRPGRLPEEHVVRDRAALAGRRDRLRQRRLHHRRRLHGRPGGGCTPARSSSSPASRSAPSASDSPASPSPPPARSPS